MPFEILVTRDYAHMSAVGAEVIRARMRRVFAAKGGCVLGLATGKSPVVLYKRLAEWLNAGEFDARGIVSFNLDEYVGLPGENPQQRALHPESYQFFMVRELLGLLKTPLAEANLPWGTLIDQKVLARELRAHPGDWTTQGKSQGKAIVIARGARSAYLAEVRRRILDGYARKIAAAGGIDLQVIGVGSRGHVAFHEAGIPFRGNGMLLVKLDGSTIANAVKDGHFASAKASPHYAVSMGCELVFKAPGVVLLASGERKVGALARSVLEPMTEGLPLSYVQRYVARGGDLTYVIDRPAAAGLLARAAELPARGVVLRDLTTAAAPAKRPARGNGAERKSFA
jgi:glucosamine-6-phosphate deaminase